jgi:hypothetical protein
MQEEMKWRRRFSFFKRKKMFMFCRTCESKHEEEEGRWQGFRFIDDLATHTFKLGRESGTWGEKGAPQSRYVHPILQG